MKNALLFGTALGVFGGGMIVAAPARAQQLELPMPSPYAKVSQRIGVNDVSLDYSSPAVKGRKIWGGLVPFGQMWRTGANGPTKIIFAKDATVGGQAVPAGTYALFTIPGEKTWTVILSKKVNQDAMGREYKKDEDQARLELEPSTMPESRERMAFVFLDTTDTSSTLALEWEKLRLSIPIKVDTASQAGANIQATLEGTWRTYANAARYTLDEKKDADGALQYADKSIALKEEWFNDWIKARTLAAKGKFKDAHAWAEKADALGKKNPQGYFYAEDVKKALAEWKNKK